MNKWEALSQKLWNKWGSKLQPKYDEIEAWKTPQFAKDLAAAVWDKIVDEGSKKFLEKFVTEVCKKYDDAFAKKLIDSVLNVFKKK